MIDLTPMILENQVQEFVVRWYFVPNTNDAYCVGSDSSLWSRYVKVGWGWVIGDDWREMTLISNGHGYLYTIISTNRGRVHVKIHQLVASFFIGPCPYGLECCHNDGNSQNNHACNLRYDTPTNNCQDKLRHGTHKRGERCHMAVLNWDLVGQIREDYTTGQYTQAQLSRKYGVTQQNIGRIVRYETWVQVDLKNT